MYFVDREHIETMLQYIEEKVKLFNNQLAWESPVEIMALERIVHMTIESILDVGNAMIDGFIMRDPGSYEDIIEILLDENVINNGAANELKEIVRYRKILMQDYTEVSAENLAETFNRNILAVEQFPNRVRDYLVNELGPVSAFSNKSE